MPTPPLIKKKLKMKELKEKKKINIVYYPENLKKRELGYEKLKNQNVKFSLTSR